MLAPRCLLVRRRRRHPPLLGTAFTEGLSAAELATTEFPAPARVIIAGHALMQNVRRGHYELGVADARVRVTAAFDELQRAI